MNMLERNDLMNTKMNSMKKLAALMAVITSVSTLTACGSDMETSGSDYAVNNEKERSIIPRRLSQQRIMPMMLHLPMMKQCLLR